MSGDRIREWKDYGTIGIVLTLTLLMFGEVSSFAQIVEPSAEALTELDERIRTHLKQNNIPGGLVALASRGHIVYLKTYGMSNVELSVPVTDKTVFEIGSISKQFSSVAVMLLVQEGKLDLDAKIHKYLPYLPGEWLGVTVRQLLNHTSGIPDYEEIRSYDVYRFRMTPEEVIKIAHSRPLDFVPGTGWYYSNTGYFLLSMIIERVEGRSLGKVMDSRIFKPLGMDDTRMADPEKIVKNRAAGYWIDKVGRLINRNPTETSSTLGAGGLLTSVYDLAKWDKMLYENEFLSAESKSTMWKPTILPNGENTWYGLGWDIGLYKGLVSQSHGGQVAGFRAKFSRFPDQDAAVIIFFNRYLVETEVVESAVLETFMSNLR